MVGITTKSIINGKRQISLDYAKGLAVLFMVFVHVQMFFGFKSSENTLFGSLVSWLGGAPAAVVFMMLLGVGVAYSKRNNFKTLIKRGVTLIAIAYLLNFLRGTLPDLIKYFTTYNSKYLYRGMLELLDVDILQFAGLVTIFFAVTKKIKLNLKHYIIIAFAIAVFNTALVPIVGNSRIIFGNAFATFIVNGIISLFVGANELSEFPFMTWIFYPILGYVFAQVLMRVENKDTFYKKIIKFVIPVQIITFIIFAIVLGIDYGDGSEMAYYHHSIAGNLIYGTFVPVWIGMIYFVTKKLPNTVSITLKRWSSNVTSIYCIHWVIIGMLGIMISSDTLSNLQFAILAVIIMLVSDLLAIQYKNFKKKTIN